VGGYIALQAKVRSWRETDAGRARAG
jgi:hypothetical protein